MAYIENNLKKKYFEESYVNETTVYYSRASKHNFYNDFKIALGLWLLR